MTTTTTTTAAKDSLATKTETHKNTVTSAAQPTDEAKDEGLATGQQRSVSSMTFRSQQTKKSGSDFRHQGTDQEVEAEANRSPSRSPVPAVVESSREARRLARESRLEALAAPPSFDSQPQSQEVTEGDKVVFKCQSKCVDLKL